MAKNKLTGTKVSKKVLGGIAASAAALGTAYYFLGPKGKTHRGQAKTWMKGARKQVVSELKRGKQVTKAAYENIVDRVTKDIKSGATSDEVKAFAQALKQDWKHIVTASQMELKRAATKAKSKVRRKKARG